MPVDDGVHDAFEEYPLTRPEYISALVHLYRGELTRANTWRIRLDTTTNWAIVAAIGILSFAFGNLEHPHSSILMGMALVLNFLVLEARRYRFFDVWRHRVRMIEENFYCPLLRRDLKSPEVAWGSLVAEDLMEPRFKITYLQAFRARLVNNYLFLFLVLLAGWVVKALFLGTQAGTRSAAASMAVGPVPGMVSAALVTTLYLFLVGVVLAVPRVETSERELWREDHRREVLPDF